MILRVFLRLINYFTYIICVIYRLVIIIRNHCVDLSKTIFTSYVNCGLFEMSRKNMQLIIGKYTHGSNEDR